MKLHSTVGILIFMLLAAMASINEANADVFLALGKLSGKASDASIGTIGYEWDKYDVSLSFIGKGEGDYGETPEMRMIDASRLFHPTWFGGGMVIGVGIAKLDSVEKNSPVDMWNFKPSIGWRGDGWSFLISHYSNGDLKELNTGFETITFRLEL